MKRENRLSKWWLVVILIATSMGVDFLFATSSGAASKNGGGTRIVTPIPGICDIAGVTEVFPDLTEPRTKRQQIAFLQGRIRECSRDIDAALAHAPTPTPTPYWIGAVPSAAPSVTPAPVCVSPPAATLGSDRFILYARLGRCFAYWTYLSTLPTPEPTESPLPAVASRPTFYVFATGAADAAAASVLIRSVVDRLSRTQRKAPSDLSIVGRADWTETSSFTSQCQLDPNTRGALIIQTSIPEAYRHNYVLIVANFSNVSASVEMLGCGAEDHNSATSPLSLWNEQAISGKAHQDAGTLGLLASLTTLLTLDRSTTTVTRSQSATTVTQTNPTAPLFTGTILSTVQSDNLTVPAQNASVGLTVASNRFADATLQRLGALCKEPEIKLLAAQSDPHSVPPPNAAHRTLRYKAASEYVADCSLFADFQL